MADKPRTLSTPGEGGDQQFEDQANGHHHHEAPDVHAGGLNPDSDPAMETVQTDTMSAGKPHSIRIVAFSEAEDRHSGPSSFRKVRRDSCAPAPVSGVAEQSRKPRFQNMPSLSESDAVSQPLRRISEVQMKEVLDLAAQRVSCTFDAFADDFAEQYNSVKRPKLQLTRNNALQKQSTFQQWAVRITSDPDFETLVLALILLNCVSMAAFEPQQPVDTGRNRILGTIETAVNIAFTLEIIFKLVAANTIAAYFRSQWNLFDFLLVAAGYTTFLPFGESTSSFKALRALRALRPLRTINRFDNLRAIVSAFIDALPMLGSVVTLTLLALSLWALTGLQLFAGMYHTACQNDTTGEFEVTESEEFSCGARECPEGWTCAVSDAKLAPNAPTMDHFLWSMLSFFQCVTLSAWSYMQYRSMDYEGWWASLLYILLVLFVALIMIQLFTAVLKLKLAKAMSSSEGPPAKAIMRSGIRQLRKVESKRNVFVRIARSARHNMANSQQSSRAMRSFADSRPGRAAAALHGRLQAFTSGTYFVNFFLFAIIVNSVLLAMEHANMSASLRQSLETANVVFTWLFTVEFVLLLASYGVVSFFASLSRSFDAIVVLVSLVEVLSASGQSGVSALRSLKTFRVLKSLRVLRVVRAFKYLRALSMISEVLGNSVTSFSAIGMLMALFLLVFAIIGLHVYGQADLDIGFPNFHTFFGSLVIVFQVMTTEDWQTLMMSTVRATDSTAVFFFLVWILVSKYVFLMLFLAVAMEAFERSYQELEPELSKIVVAPALDLDIEPTKDPEVAQRVFFASMAEAFNSEAQFRQSVILSAGHSALQHHPGTPPHDGAAGQDAAGPVQGTAARQAPVPGLDLSGVAVAPGGRVADPAPAVTGLQVPEQPSSTSASAGNTTRERKTDSSELAFVDLGLGEAVCESRRADSMSLQETEEEAIDAWLGTSPSAAGASHKKPLTTAIPGLGDGVSSGLPEDHQGGFLHRLVQGAHVTSTGGVDAQAAVREDVQRAETGHSEHDPQQLSEVGTSLSSLHAPGPCPVGQASHSVSVIASIPSTPGLAASPGHLDTAAVQESSSGTAEPGMGCAAGGETGGAGDGGSSKARLDAGDGGLTRGASGAAGPSGVAGSTTVQAVRRILVGHDPIDLGVADHASASEADIHSGYDPVAPLPDPRFPDNASSGSSAGAPVGLELLLTTSLQASGGQEQEYGNGTTHAALCLQEAGCSTKIEYNPFFSDDGMVHDPFFGDDEEGRLGPSGKQGLPAGSNGVPFGGAASATPSALTRSEHVEDDSDSDSEGPHRRVFRDLLNQIRFKDGSAENTMVIESILQNILRCGTQDFFAAVAIPEFEQRNRRSSPDFVPDDGLHSRGIASASALFVSARGEPRRLVELQLTRAMLVVQHPIIQAQLLADERPQQIVAGIIAQAMLSGLDSFVSRSTDVPLPPTSSKLENLMLQLDHVPLADSSTTCAYKSEEPSLFLFGPDHRVRRLCTSIARNQYFHRISLALVSLTCVLLAVEDPHTAERRPVFAWIELFTLAYFTFEAAVEIVDSTFLVYVRQWSHVLDLVVICNTLVALLADASANAEAIKVMRALRLMRLVRLIARSPSMLNVVQSISLSVKEMSNVVLILLLIITIFAILGVQLFAGKLYYCTDPSATGKADCVGTYTTGPGIEAPREWRNSKHHFDSLGAGLMSLLITLTLDGYLEIMFPCMAITGADTQPRTAANPAAFFFFFAYITVCVFAIMQLMIGIIFYYYTKVKRGREGKADLNLEQRQWLTMCNLVFEASPPPVLHPPRNRVRNACYQLMSRVWVEQFVSVVVLLNVLIMAASWYPPAPGWVVVQEALNTGFSCFYAVEVAIKMLAFGPRAYLMSLWNRFDLLLVCIGILDLVVLVLPAGFLRVVRLIRLRRLFRLLRVLRLMRVFRTFHSVVHLVLVLRSSREGLWHVGTVVFFVFYVYAYVGVLIFGKVRRGPTLNEHANFETFPNALLLLFRIATADEWTGIMDDVGVAPPLCDRAAGDCGSGLGPLYIMSFTLLTGQIMLNLFTTIVIETFEEMDEVNRWSVNPEVISIFSQLWSVLDPGTGSITAAQLLWLLQRLPEPLGASELTGAKAKLRNMLLFRDESGRVPFRTTLYELMRAAIAVPLPQNVRVVQQHLAKMQQFFERHPIDSDSMARALWGTFDVDYLLVDEEDVLWGSDDSSCGEAGGGRGSAGSMPGAQHDAGPPPEGAGTQSVGQREYRDRAGPDSDSPDAAPGAGGVAAPGAWLWGLVRTARFGLPTSQERQHVGDNSSLGSRLENSSVGASIADGVHGKLGTQVGSGLALSQEVRNLVAQEVEAQFSESRNPRFARGADQGIS